MKAKKKKAKRLPALTIHKHSVGFNRPKMFTKLGACDIGRALGKLLPVRVYDDAERNVGLVKKIDRVCQAESPPDKAGYSAASAADWLAVTLTHRIPYYAYAARSLAILARDLIHKPPADLPRWLFK